MHGYKWKAAGMKFKNILNTSVFPFQSRKKQLLYVRGNIRLIWCWWLSVGTSWNKSSPHRTVTEKKKKRKGKRCHQTPSACCKERRSSGAQAQHVPSAVLQQFSAEAAVIGVVPRRRAQFHLWRVTFAGSFLPVPIVNMLSELSILNFPTLFINPKGN